MSREIFVHIALGEKNIFVGRVWIHSRKGRESASFEYDRSWLTHPERFALEPALKLIEGVFHTGDNQNVFGAIGDSAPDRWGRVLMRRAEVRRAKSEKETARTLSEADYLLGVNDELRQGALRFSEKYYEPPSFSNKNSIPLNRGIIDSEFLSPKDKQSIPPLVDLPKLLAASERLIDDKENSEDLRLLLAPGSSLGGARPKSSVLDKNGNLAIAKFSRKDDEFSVEKWEAVALTLAKNSGIATPEFSLIKIGKKPTLIVKRFDRIKKTRIPFLSAMSMLQARDNEQHSYLEIAYALAQNGAAPEEDMKQLWRRIVFNVLISNTDDHLRNHGFLYESHGKNGWGWRLSPAYDLNPTPVEIKPRILTTAIDLDDTAASLKTALSVAKDFRLEKFEAIKIIKEVAKAVSKWREVAKNFDITKKEIERMASAFEHEDLEGAKKL
ncbi:MAG: type II toxin-antitoxin system HipA family toxin [Rickettsiales bacterium]|nr:type II toxin-antitoxin system HipA family toxin [Rickettsiales bacterium]